MSKLRFGLRLKLLFFSSFLLTIPWLGYQYVWEMETYLRIGQEQTMVGTARAVATALHERPALFDSQSAYLTDVKPGTDLYAHKIAYPIQLDGKLDDWQDYRHLSIAYDEQNLIDSIQDYQLDSLHFTHMVGQYDRFLYAMFDVTDNKVLLRPTNSLRIDKNDHLQIAMTDQSGLFQRYIIAPTQPGWVNAYLLKDDLDSLQPERLETKIQGQWRNTVSGYQLELRFPLTMISSKIAFAIVDVDRPLRALAFKIMDDRFGALTFTRIYSGKLEKGSSVLNTFTGKTERIGRIVEMHADDRMELDSAQAGDIVAIVGMKNVQTGHTLCDPKFPATLEPMVFPEPVISISITPKDQSASEKMGVALGKMIKEDPSFHVETDEESGETIIKGMGELHLDIKVDILRRTHMVDVTVGKPQVAYRETITQRIEDSYTHKKQTGGSGQFGKIDYVIEPGEPGSGYEFESKVTGGNVPREFWTAVEKGFGVCMIEGVLAGFPLLDVKITLVDGAFHAVDSSAIAFETAAKGGYRQSIPKASPQLMEPIMKVDVFVPEDHVGDVIGDLNRRRGMIRAQEAAASGVRVRANVPLSEMFGYIGDLRTMTSGRGQFSMEFEHYLPCPKNVSEQVIKEVKERKEAKK
mgnify:CR=1 FL=1